MAALLINALKPALLEYLDKALKGAPATIKALLASIVAWLPSSIDKATALFRSTYASTVTRLMAWLPTQEAALVALVGKAGGWAKKRIEAL